MGSRSPVLDLRDGEASRDDTDGGAEDEDESDRPYSVEEVRDRLEVEEEQGEVGTSMSSPRGPDSVCVGIDPRSRIGLLLGEGGAVMGAVTEAGMSVGRSASLIAFFSSFFLFGYVTN